MDDPSTLLRLRAALKFSLWAWAIYWPGGAILLLAFGMDVISILVGLAALGQFLFLLSFGFLRPDPKYSRNLKSFLVERPLYLVFGLIGFLLLGTLFAPSTNVALALFSALQVTGLVLVALRLMEHVRSLGIGIMAAKADQMVLVLAFTGLPALAVFWDAVVPLFGGPTLGNPAASVALVNFINLGFPAMLVIASRPFGIRLSTPRVLTGELPVPGPAPGTPVPTMESGTLHPAKRR